MRIGLDLDGTLVSCVERHTALMRAAARQVGQSVDTAALWLLKRSGKDNRDALRQMGLSAESIAAMAAIWSAAIESLQWLAFDRVLAAPDTLRAAKARGHTLHVITARSIPPHARQQLARLGLLPLFDSLDIVAPTQSAIQKAAAMAHRGCELYVGDAESDRLACQKADIAFRAVSSGMRSSEYLLGLGLLEVWPDINQCMRDL